MPRPSSDELLKKVVGKRKRSDVWDELFRLNRLATKLGLQGAADDGYPPKKVVGKRRVG